MAKSVELRDSFDGSDQWDAACTGVVQADAPVPLETTRPVPWAIAMGRTDPAGVIDGTPDGEDAVKQ